ncbi:MATE family efflux transporter [Sulfitobacter sp. LCG007]
MTPGGTGDARPQHPFEVRHRDIWRIALPACLAFVTEPLAGIVDTTVIGRLGDAGLLAGLSIGAVAFNTLFALAFFLRFGTAGLTAQAIGARDPLDGLYHLVRAFVFALLLGFVALVFAGPILAGFEAWFNPPPGAAPAFSDYYKVRMASVPFVLVNFVLLGWFYGRARAMTGLLLQMVINVVNIVLSVGFVHGLGWGVPGVALATVLAQVCATVLGLVLVLRHYGGPGRLRGALSLDRLAEMAALRRMLALSRDLTIRSLALNGVFAYFTAEAGRQGDAALAAVGVLMQLTGFATFLLDGIATAVEQLSGRAVGANWRPAFETSIRLSFLWGAFLSVALCAAIFGIGGLGIDAISTSEEVRDVARRYLVMAAIVPLTGMPAYLLDGVMIGATLNTVMRNGMLASAAVFLAFAWVLEPSLQIWGLWIAFHAMLLARAAIYALWIARQRDSLFTAPDVSARPAR